MLILLLGLILQPDSLDVPPMESMGYAADSLHFLIDSENLILIGEASLEYTGMGISADTIRYEAERETVTASGNMELTDAGETARGTGLVYHMPTATARTWDTSSLYDRAIYSAETITMLSRDEFNLTNVKFTSCEKDTFDYYFWSSRMKVFPDDKAVAGPVTLFIEETPVFWVPFAVFPIRRGRSSGFTIPTIGASSRDGRYLREVGYYFGFSDYADLLLSADLMEKTRFQVTATERHSLRYVMNGRTRLQWRRQFENSRDRWLVETLHTHELPDGTMVKLTGNFVSDRSYLEETQQDPQERMESELRSWLSFSRNLGRGSAQMNLEYTEYLDALPDTIDGELLSELTAPDLRYSLPSAPVFHTPADPEDRRPWHSLYWSLSGHYLTESTQWEDSSLYNAGLRLESNLSASERLGGILAISPSIRGRGTLYDRDRMGNGYPGWFHGSAGLALSTDIYGLFASDFLGHSLLRHTITPTVSATWTPDRFITTQGMENTEAADSLYYSFSDLSLPSSGTAVALSLANVLEGKRVSRGTIERNTLAELTVGTSWNPEAEEGENAFSRISGSLNLTPARWFSTRLDGSWDPYGRETRDLSLTTGITLSGNDPTLRPDSGVVISPLMWRLTISHNWRPEIGEEAIELNKLRVSAAVDLTSRWSVNYRAYYDITESDFISQDYTIMRDLDSWEAVFTRHVSDVDTGFYFRINIKAFPDIKVEQHTSSF
ncbi:MAG TPA: putative LPS assembly protein LptD [Candidatus Sabulitectum sp.]|nr:putative LPS assembly protein LptD [Candidatus Sabulitectum sp.]HPJ29058.1 putative LPS assembly protein LptD [Candidatus Sabulitectum sp.]